MSVAEFLLARIAEDEELAHDHPPADGALALLATVRRMTRSLIPLAAEEVGDERHASQLIRKFASAYADHPDYRDEWAL